MPNVRSTSLKKYNISSHRFMELYHYCLQYNEWKDELNFKNDTVRSVEISDMPTAHNRTDATQELAIRRAELSEKCKVIEETTREADEILSQYILKAVTNEGISYNYLRTVCGIPCGKNMYYDARRKFFYLLSKKI